jgi:hypothetical protein
VILEGDFAFRASLVAGWELEGALVRALDADSEFVPERALTNLFGEVAVAALILPGGVCRA